MNTTSKTIIGSILMLIGLSIFFGGSFGGLIPSLIGAWLIYLGITKYDKGNKTVGVILAVIGVLLIVQAIPFLMGIAFAVALLYFGWQLLGSDTTKDASHTTYTESETVPNMEEPIRTSFDQEWEHFLKKK
ncbi:hypothetical protein [Bacillus sp. 179-C3.3 HS]|uniref:hypothetical protein n=1 Tax=Bacillus sp. 179-C3.3 HS TaxID=3232162 RepID=UPI0039A28A79